MSNFNQIFPIGETNDAFADYFTGQSYNAPVVDGNVPVINVTFEPACRNNWHIHHGTEGGGDQILLCTAGSGWFQAEGNDPISMEPGTAIRVPSGTKHWHGAKADSWFSHLAFITPGTDVSNEWLEPVTDEVYSTLPKVRTTAPSSAHAMRIKLTINGTELTGILGQGPAARDFVKLLPLTAELTDSNACERVADLPRPLNVNGEPAGTSAGPGDIAHYAPWGNLALFGVIVNTCGSLI